MIRLIERGPHGAAVGAFDEARARALLEDPNALFWVDLADPTDEETEILASVFRFHPLTIDDCIFEVLSPKVEAYDGYIFLVIHGIDYKADGKQLLSQELNCYLGPNYVVTFHYPQIRPIEDVINRCARSPRLLGRGAEMVLYEIVNALADDYLPVSDALDQQLDEMENRVVREPKREVLLEILELKRVVVRLRRILIPQREVLRKLGSGEFDVISREGTFFFRDAYDHLHRVSELAELQREVISSALDAYLSSVSNRLNEVMKVLTIIATLILPMTLITGIYGMNFDFMPELRWRYGYPASLGFMFLVGSSMVLYFRRRGWF